MKNCKYGFGVDTFCLCTSTRRVQDGGLLVQGRCFFHGHAVLLIKTVVGVIVGQKVSR